MRLPISPCIFFDNFGYVYGTPCTIFQETSVRVVWQAKEAKVDKEPKGGLAPPTHALVLLRASLATHVVPARLCLGNARGR
mgnify:CR=1 FL=1